MNHAKRLPGNPKNAQHLKKYAKVVLKARLNLTTVYVLQNPTAEWIGEQGYITAEMFKRHLPLPYDTDEYFICGPDVMMDAIENALKELGVPLSKYHSERYSFVYIWRPSRDFQFALVAMVMTNEAGLPSMTAIRAKVRAVSVRKTKTKARLASAASFGVPCP